MLSFNTQPREGGCRCYRICRKSHNKFQHTAARRRLQFYLKHKAGANFVSTHSRAKAAASKSDRVNADTTVSTHSRAKAAAELHEHKQAVCLVSTHSRAKAAALPLSCASTTGAVSTHSRAKAAALCAFFQKRLRRFQHTAARRRLQPWTMSSGIVS